MTGPRFAIDAIAMGKEAAVSIHRYVHPGQSLVNGRDRRAYYELDKENLIFESYDRMPRQRVLHVDGKKSKKTFKDLRSTFTEEQMKKETERCLGCGATVRDEYMCIGCGACTVRCKFEAISLVRKYDEEGVELEKLKPIIIKSMIKRKGRIAVRKVRKIFKS
jgi:ferredoxin